MRTPELPGTVAALSDDLGAWCERLADAAVAEREQVFGHRDDMPGRGRTTAPVFRVQEANLSCAIRAGLIRVAVTSVSGTGVHGGHR